MAISPIASRRGSAQPAPATPTAEELKQAYDSELVDKHGKAATFGQVIDGRRTVVIFIRHFWCGVCSKYVEILSTSIPRGNLPEGTQLVIIGCGNATPIPSYIESTGTPYEIYGNPSLSLYKFFGFTSNLGTSKKGEEKKYERDLGSTTSRVWGALKAGPMRNPLHAGSVGPISQNGGEVVIEQDGTCSFIHRMKNTADHTDLDILAKQIGATYLEPAPSRRGSKVRKSEERIECGEQCAVAE